MVPPGWEFPVVLLAETCEAREPMRNPPTQTYDDWTAMKWFINEDLGTYPYDPAKQQEDFPNDFPLAFDTAEQADAEADRMYEWDQQQQSRANGLS